MNDSFNSILVTYLYSLFSNTSRLAEVGKLEPVKINGNYDTGQAFLHRLDGYRGVVLFPWTARVYDRDKRDVSRYVQLPRFNTYFVKLTI